MKPGFVPAETAGGSVSGQTYVHFPQEVHNGG
jgi:hypothetical protein